MKKLVSLIYLTMLCAFLQTSLRAQTTIKTVKFDFLTKKFSDLNNFRTGSGMVYEGGSGGNGLNSRVSGVRIMDAKTGPKPDGPRVIYMNSQGQTVNPSTGRTVPPTDPSAHIPIKDR